MKRTFLLICAAALFACNSSDKTTSENDANKNEVKVAGMTAKDMPYQVKDWADWQPGNMENAKTAMSGLKNFCDGNVDASLESFGDSVAIRFDDVVGKFSKDSLKKMFTDLRGMYKTMDVNMEDFESVKSKDGKEEWVTLWYQQKWQDQKGKWDSAVYVDDMKFENGKVTVLDEKTRHYPKKM